METIKHVPSFLFFFLGFWDKIWKNEIMKYSRLPFCVSVFFYGLIVETIRGLTRVGMAKKHERVLCQGILVHPRERLVVRGTRLTGHTEQALLDCLSTFPLPSISTRSTAPRGQRDGASPLRAYIHSYLRELLFLFSFSFLLTVEEDS